MWRLEWRRLIARLPAALSCCRSPASRVFPATAFDHRRDGPALAVGFFDQREIELAGDQHCGRENGDDEAGRDVDELGTAHLAGGRFEIEQIGRDGRAIDLRARAFDAIAADHLAVVLHQLIRLDRFAADGAVGIERWRIIRGRRIAQIGHRGDRRAGERAARKRSAGRRHAAGSLAGGLGGGFFGDDLELLPAAGAFDDLPRRRLAGRRRRNLDLRGARRTFDHSGHSNPIVTSGRETSAQIAGYLSGWTSRGRESCGELRFFDGRGGLNHEVTKSTKRFLRAKNRSLEQSI